MSSGKIPAISLTIPSVDPSHRRGWILPTILILGLIAAATGSIWFFLKHHEAINIQSVSSPAGGDTKDSIVSFFRKSNTENPQNAGKKTDQKTDQNTDQSTDQNTDQNTDYESISSNGLKNAANIIENTYNGSDAQVGNPEESDSSDSGNSDSSADSQSSTGRKKTKRKASAGDKIGRAHV